ncbi:Hypothetical predicted protein [Scomber scombrus]|uniref:Uncharacterized protein n=1 Tax=Scomber scombrus TaxID=13677 RepID=A0AAV1NPW7_SCOSC
MEGGGEDGESSSLTHSDVASHPSLTRQERTSAEDRECWDTSSRPFPVSSDTVNRRHRLTLPDQKATFL